MDKKYKFLHFKKKSVDGIITEEKIYNGMFSLIYNYQEDFLDMHLLNNVFISIILLAYKIQKDHIYDTQLEWIVDRAIMVRIPEKYIKTYVDLEFDKHKLKDHLDECKTFPYIIILYELMLMILEGNAIECRSTDPNIFDKAKEILNINKFEFESIYNLVSIELGLFKVRKKFLDNYKKKLD